MIVLVVALPEVLSPRTCFRRSLGSVPVLDASASFDSPASNASCRGPFAPLAVHTR